MTSQKIKHLNLKIKNYNKIENYGIYKYYKLKKTISSKSVDNLSLFFILSPTILPDTHQ